MLRKIEKNFDVKCVKGKNGSDCWLSPSKYSDVRIEYQPLKKEFNISTQIKKGNKFGPIIRVPIPLNTSVNLNQVMASRIDPKKLIGSTVDQSKKGICININQDLMFIEQGKCYLYR